MNVPTIIPPGEYPAYFGGYVALAEGADLCAELVRAAKAVEEAFSPVAEAKGDHRYAPGKWTIKEVLHHISDTERVFMYRALCIARKESASLPAFDEDAYEAAARAGRHAMAGLLAEYRAVHAASLALVRSFGEEDLVRIGTANGKTISVRAMGRVAAGHALHHVNVLRARYLG